MTDRGMLGLFALLGIGGAVAYAVYSKKAEAAPTLAKPNGQGLPAYTPQWLIDLYTRCYEQGCSQADYDRVQAELASLAAQYPADAALWQMFSNELAKRSPEWWAQQQGGASYGGATPGGYTSTSAGQGINWGGLPDLGIYPPTLPAIVPDSLVAEYNDCWKNLNCTGAEVTALGQQLQYWANSVANQAGFAGTPAYNEIMYAAQSLWSRYTGTGGVVGRHTGGCSCEKRQEEVGTGACCSACARGEECDECGEHQEETTVG